MRILKITILLFWAAFLPVAVFAADNSLYPPDYSITSIYSPVNSSIEFGDTLTIDRILVNNESFSLYGLYFSDNYPPEFQIIEHTVHLNGSTLAHEFELEEGRNIFSGYDLYYWIIDYPDAIDSTQNIITPGDSLHLQLRIIAENPGSYELPMHTVVFYGNNGGIFATSDTRTIQIGDLCGDANSDNGVNILDVTFLINYLYKEGPPPLNADLADANGDGTINILDVTILVNFLYKSGPPPQCL